MSRNTITRTARRGVRVALVLALSAATVGLLNGAARKPRAKRDDPWFNGRNAFTFPVADGVPWPDTPDALAAAMARGYGRTAVLLPDGAAPVSVRGTTLRDVHALRVDLSNASVDPDRKAAKVGRKAKAERSLHVRRLEFLAHSFTVRGAAMNLAMTALDCRLDLKRDKAGKPVLALGDLLDGRLEFSMPVRDIEMLLVESARADGGALGFRVEDVDLDLESVGPRTARGRMHVKTKLAFIGAGLHFTGRIDIDDDMNARVSDLACWGDDVLGPVVTGLIRPGLAKYNGKTRPIVRFGSDDVRLRDVALAADDDHVRVTASFGR